MYKNRPHGFAARAVSRCCGVARFASYRRRRLRSIGRASETGSSAAPELEATEWSAVSINPHDYGIDDDALNAVYLPDFAAYPLDKLCAYCLYTDGAGAEGSYDELYQRFIEAPKTVVTYLSLMGGSAARGGAAGDETAASELCRAIASTQVYIYGTTDDFSSAMRECKSVYTSGGAAAVLQMLQDEYDSAVKSSSGKK